jgi:hypothetical protein
MTPALTFGFNSTLDLFEKLQRDADALDERVTGDKFFDFVVTGYSMIDWVKQDNSLSEQARNEAGDGTLHKDRWLNICGDLATASKHCSVARRAKGGNVVTDSTEHHKGYGAGRFGRGPFGVGEEWFDIALKDGTEIHCLELVEGVLKTWQEFFGRHGISVEIRVPT